MIDNVRNNALKCFPGAFCKRNPESGLYVVYFNGGSVGCGTTPTRAWQDAYLSREKGAEKN